MHHASRDEAEAHMREVLTRHGSDSSRLKVYRCGCCGDWHVGRSRYEEPRSME
jgi:hypothetical protein